MSTVPAEGKKAAKPRAAPLPGNKALDLFWDKRIREAGKIVRPSPLFPRSQRRAGKAQFNWMPTSDLARRWPFSFLIWGAVMLIIGLVFTENRPATDSSGTHGCWTRSRFSKAAEDY